MSLAVALIFIAGALISAAAWSLPVLLSGRLLLGFGIGGAWLLIAEIFPPAERGRGMAAATSANWLTDLIVAASFLCLLSILGRPGIFFTYAALTGAALYFAWRLVPETKGLTLKAINTRWNKPAALDLNHRRKVPEPRRSPS